MPSPRYRPEDCVKSTSPRDPFWMRIVSVNNDLGIAECRFGDTDRDAGVFRLSELRRHKPRKVRVAKPIK